MRFGVIQPVTEAAYLSDKMATLLAIRAKESAKTAAFISNRNTTYSAAQAMRYNTARYSHNFVHSITNNVPLFNTMSESTLICTAADREAEKHIARLSYINQKLLDVSKAEAQERKRLISTQTFSSSFLESGKGVFINQSSSISDISISPIRSAPDSSAISMMQCEDDNLLALAKWIQAMLQLEGDDRFNTFQLSLPPWRGNARSMFSFTNQKASIVVTGYTGGKEEAYYPNRSIIHFMNARHGHGQFGAFELVYLGSTKAATLVRV